jgi:uncharacterized protein YndB with AHSA1/START domain
MVKEYNGSMKNLQLTRMPVAKAEMLIRKPVAEVLEAFVDPEITRRFWFTKSSEKLKAGGGAGHLEDGGTGD